MRSHLEGIFRDQDKIEYEIFTTCISMKIKAIVYQAEEGGYWAERRIVCRI
jgi:hypothetical protein